MERKHSFVGEFEHALDSKGRLIIPAKFRAALGERFFVMRGMNASCLYVLPQDEWELKVQIFESISEFDDEAQDYARFLFADAEEREMDSQGRIVIPPKLREAAGVDDDVVVVGNRRRVEIWQKKRYLESKERFYAREKEVKMYMMDKYKI
ncbi:MAG: division/cell wall cluster transcriptional repressor MraZ [Armatimonadetes bacterium]|nr:division/cell wall cluster transcriptional repressor MraZ [Armatimonadota bacterium]